MPKRSGDHDALNPETITIPEDFGDKRKNIYANRYCDTSRRFRGIWNLLLLWKGSVIKLIWHDLLVFIVLYSILSIMYRNVFFYNDDYREYFELICIYSSRFRNLIPITFLTGFYVSQVVTRWWDQFMALPFPDRVALKLVSFIPGQDDFRRNLKLTVMRYINLSFILVFRLVSHKVHARFPNYQSLIDAKLILEHEAKRLQAIDERTPHEATWTPVLWALKLIQRARTEKKIEMDPPIFAALVGSFDYVEQCNRRILNYGWVNFPLAYTQVATVSVYLYFLVSLFACQYLSPHDDGSDADTKEHNFFPHLKIKLAVGSSPYVQHTPDLYVPAFNILEFISYMGWIKVAENLLNPFGDDDEDFQINYLIDRNLQVSYLIVDEAEGHIELSPDPFLEAGIKIPDELPYPNDVSKTLNVPNLDTDDTVKCQRRKTSSISQRVRNISWNRRTVSGRQERRTTTTTTPTTSPKISRQQGHIASRKPSVDSNVLFPGMTTAENKIEASLCEEHVSVSRSSTIDADAAAAVGDADQDLIVKDEHLKTKSPVRRKKGVNEDVPADVAAAGVVAGNGEGYCNGGMVVDEVTNKVKGQRF